MRYSSILPAAIVVVGLTTAASAQTPPAQPASAQPAPVEALQAPGTPAATNGADWNAVSRSTTRVYLVDVNSIKQSGDVSAITLARIPVAGPTVTGYAHVSVEMEYRCAAKQSRAVAETEHDDAGAPLDRFESGEDFSPYNAQALDAYVAAVVCDGDRAAPPTYPSVKAFIDGGRR